MNLDWLWVLFDVVFIVYVIWCAKASALVKIETKSNNKLLFAVMFYAVGVMSFFQYDGLLKYSQAISLFVLGTSFFFVKSGLADDGIVMFGVMKKWDDIKKVEMNHGDNSLSFQTKSRPIKIYFEKEQMKLVHEMLENKGKKK